MTEILPAPAPPVTVTLSDVWACVDVLVGLLTSVDVLVGLLTSVDVDPAAGVVGAMAWVDAVGSALLAHPPASSAIPEADERLKERREQRRRL